MPYITKRDREKIITEAYIHMDDIDTPGELNYAITEMMINYIKNHGMSYTNMNEAIGALECAKLEFYRRMTAPYEDTKIEENGDVYREVEY